MKNYALVFAGGTGQRMNTREKPKQFMLLHGKTVLVHTLHNFEQHPEIEEIVVVCVEDWIDHCWQVIREAHLSKVRWVVPGGSTGQQSIFQGVKKLYDNCDKPSEAVVLVHDGVRPLVSPGIISKNIAMAREKGAVVTISPASETVVIIDDSGQIVSIPNRSQCMLSKAPQTYCLKTLMSVHLKAVSEGVLRFTNSAELMHYYGHEIFTLNDVPENIKITTPLDFYICRAIMDVEELKQFVT